MGLPWNGLLLTGERGSEASGWVVMPDLERSKKRRGLDGPPDGVEPSEREPSPAAPSDSTESSSTEPVAKSLDALPRPAVAPRNWDDLPGIRKRRSLAPPAPPPSNAPPPPTTHDLFDVDSAEAEHEREEVFRRAERRSARPHPPRKSVNPHAPRNLHGGRHLSTPLSWEAAKPVAGDTGDGLADAIEEEISDEFLEPVADSAPLALPQIDSAEPLASVIPTGVLVTAPPEREHPRRRTPLTVVVLAAPAVLAVGWFVTRSEPRASESQARASDHRVAPAATLAAPALETSSTLRVPLPPLELDLGVPASAPATSAEADEPDPASLPPVAPKGVLPELPSKPEHPPFDNAAASVAMSQAAQSASTCRKSGDPAGKATVIVRYAPSGRVTSAVVESGPFAGTVTGGCIATTFRKTRVPPFSGDYVSVKKTISLD